MAIRVICVKAPKGIRLILRAAAKRRIRKED